MLIAYCYRDGQVVFTDEAVPEGAVELCRGPSADVGRAIRETTDTGWIPHLSESTSVADDQQHLLIYLETLKEAAGRLVTVNDLSQDALESDVEVTG